ncbi:MAG: SRPBCC family protein [Deltaproteobacteria bacterium]|nr:MAG: SRPBCC family protein [Deltaproteobacteria bacterium]
MLAAAGASAATPENVRVYQNPDDDAITEGETTLAAEPDVAYRAATDYLRWAVMFSDIRHVIVTSQNGNDARVTFVHFDGNRDNIHFRNQPAARMVWFEDTGGRAEVWAEIVFLRGDRPGTTRVHSRLYADVHGLASLFVSNRKIRRLREQRVHDQLTELRAYFTRAMEAQR